jgi:hypothetical protein
VEEVCWLLRKAAVHAGDAGSILAVDWELMNKSMSQVWLERISITNTG